MKAASSSRKQRITAKLYQAVLFLLAHTHVKHIARIGKGVGHLAYYLCAKRRRIVARNLRIVIDPKLRPEQLQALIKRNFVLTCMNFACALKVGLMTAEEMEESIRLVGKETYEDAGSEGRTGLACIPHAGNWEVLARIRPLFTRVKHFGSMYRRMSNPALEEIVYNSRTRFGCEMYSKEGGIMKVLRMARAGGLLGVLSDQFTNEGVYVPYFGKVTGTTPLPSILRKSCKGQLFAVYTRNRGLGQWDAVLGTKIPWEENTINQTAADTILINNTLQRCQEENILEGFWMHHRWKCTRNFAPVQEEGVAELARPHTKLPFRIIIALPESLEDALHCIPALRCLKNCRFDAELTLICSPKQAAFWALHPDLGDEIISYGDASSMKAQFDADAVYQKGPFDVFFCLSEQAELLPLIKHLSPMLVSGFKENKYQKKFSARGTELHKGPQQLKSQDYLSLLSKIHEIATDAPELLCPSQGGNAELKAFYIVPFSHLGTADSWPPESWQEIVAQRPDCQVLALQKDAPQAESLAKSLNIPLVLCTVEDIHQKIGPQCQVVGVDGEISHLAAFYGARLSLIMASRHPDRYAPWAANCQAFYRHLDCHPCYADSCASGKHCSQSIGAQELLKSLDVPSRVKN